MHKNRQIAVSLTYAVKGEGESSPLSRLYSMKGE